MRVMVLQCALINPPFKIPSDPPHPPPSASMISRSLFILLPQIVKSIPLIMAKTAKTTAIRTGEASPPLLFRHVSPGPGDIVGHLKLVDGQALHQRPVLCTKDDSASRKVMVHLQLKDGPVINVYLWDEAAVSFRLKFDASEATPTVLLVTTENGGDAAELEVPLPQCFIDTIGQTKKFRIKVAHYNFTSTRLFLTATKIVSPAVLPPKNPPLNTPPTLLAAQNHRPGAEVEISDVAESSGGGTLATDDQKKAKRTKRSG
ncbi:hypothetical protein Bca4012_073131 [Brassica carinata]